MAKIMVLQHVGYEPLGTLDPLIRSKKHKIHYINFGRSPYAKPNIKGYDALIILGGPMNIGDEVNYPHLFIEKALILEAMQVNIAILGICLGAQLIASAMGAKVFPAKHKEIGWHLLRTTEQAQTDALGSLFSQKQKIFQWHGFTFDLPKGAIPLLQGEEVVNQAFKLKDNVYAFQFHLEADRFLIKRWLNLPEHQIEFGLNEAKEKIDAIWSETEKEIERSVKLSEVIFSAFLELLPNNNKLYTFSHQ